ncbi:MAG: hypothetical protein AB8F94_04975 [Saprospiraceae bacterium]
MNNLITISIFLFLFSTIGNAQIQVSELDRFTHLRQLRDGILLVQLPNRDKKIAKLKEIGLSKRAKTEAEEVKLEREGLIEGFEKKFEFCNVLYFEREHTMDILKGNYKNVFDSEYELVSDFPEVSEIYVAQYGVGHPNGEVSSYNGVGIQIRHVNNGQLETINHDYFYKRSKVGLIMGRKKAVIKGIKNLNYNLNKVPVEKY